MGKRELTDEQRASAKRAMQEVHETHDRLQRETQEALWESNRDPYMELLAEKEALQAQNELFRDILTWYANASDYELDGSQIRARWALEGKKF